MCDFTLMQWFSTYDADNSYQNLGWFAYWVIFYAFLLSANLFQLFQIVILGLLSELSNSLDPDQTRQKLRAWSGYKLFDNVY